MSREMGYAPNYLSTVTKGKTPVSVTLKVLLDKLYGIKIEDYMENEAQQHEKQERGLTEEQRNELYKIVYAAVYEAVKKARNE